MVYIDNKFNDPSSSKSTEHVDFNEKNLDKVRVIKGNAYPALGHLTPNTYVGRSIEEATLVRKKKRFQ